MPLRRPQVLLALAALLALVIALVALLAGSAGERSTSAPAGPAAASTAFAGAELPPGTPAPGFALTDTDGRRVALADYRGRVAVLAFLGSGCAPACVLIAQQIRGALDDLSHPVPVLLVSVEPAGDTRARVRAFLASVGLAGRVRYLNGPAAALAAVWRAYRVITPSAGRAAFERAAPVLLIDRTGHERVIFQQEQLTPEALAHDIGKLEGG
jgi:protein SCO1/2